MKLFRQGLLAVLCAAAALGAAAGPASAAITSQGIAGVKLGMTRSQVSKVLGPPSGETEEHGQPRIDYKKKKLNVLFWRGRAVRVRTQARSEQTAAGVGPGTKESAARRRLNGESCVRNEKALMCSFVRGKNVLEFNIVRGRVAYVGVLRASLER
jgi:hypothetical protein